MLAGTKGVAPVRFTIPLLLVTVAAVAQAAPVPKPKPNPKQTPTASCADDLVKVGKVTAVCEAIPGEEPLLSIRPSGRSTVEAPEGDAAATLVCRDIVGTCSWNRRLELPNGRCTSGEEGTIRDPIPGTMRCDYSTQHTLEEYLVSLTEEQLAAEEEDYEAYVAARERTGLAAWGFADHMCGKFTRPALQENCPAAGEFTPPSSGTFDVPCCEPKASDGPDAAEQPS